MSNMGCCPLLEICSCIVATHSCSLIRTKLCTACMQIEALKMEIADLRAARAASAGFNLPSAGDMLQSLGLDKWKDDRLRGPKVRR